MASHKSPSGQRWAARRESRDILATRRARTLSKREGTASHEWVEVPGRGYESTGHYHWRLGHKNLAKPILRTKRVVVVTE